jgi:uncharacterized repeat protein (TIGR01451 family)
MKKKFFCLLIFLLTLASPLKEVKAYAYEVAAPSSQISVDKKIRSVSQKDWYDNLGTDNNIFSAEDLIEFKIIIKNSGDSKLTNIQLTDYLPQYLNTVFYPGSFDEENRQIHWSFDSLESGEEKESRIRVQVVKADQLPNSSQFCLTNKVEVKTAEGPADGDTAQFCLETRVLAEKLPEAGTKIIFATLITISFAGLGIIARKFGRGEIIN